MVQKPGGNLGAICQEKRRRKEGKQSSERFSLSLSSAPLQKQAMAILQGSVVASPQVPSAGCVGSGSDWWYRCLPLLRCHVPPGPSVGLGLCCTVGRFASTPLLQVEGLMMHHDTAFPGFHVVLDNLLVWGRLLVGAASLSSLPQKYTAAVTSYWLQERRMAPVKSHTVLPFSPVKNKHDIISLIIKYSYMQRRALCLSQCTLLPQR